ncbi:MAG: hypothetical protein QNK04_22650 [Myxococcota bacterium]|nr:hypothetical protein [Myxococcota bacterium]
MDRLCAVGRTEGIDTRRLARNTAIEASRRQLRAEVRGALESMLAGTSPGGGQGLDTLARRITDATGRLAEDGTWESPNCTVYALTELELDHFMMVIEPADVSPAARSRIQAGARAAFEE